MSVQNSFYSLQLLPKHAVQTNRNKANCLQSSLLFFVWLHIYFETEKNCLKWPLELIVLRYHLVVTFCIIILIIYSTGYYDKCFKNGEHLKLFEDTIYGAPKWVNKKKYVVLFGPDFKYKVDSFNLYIIDNYVKKTIGRCLPRIE